MFTVYQHINKLNGKVYIGITKQLPEVRWGVGGCNYGSSTYFYQAIQKYGWDNFEHIILFENLTKEEACLKEQELIRYYNSMDKQYGYNQTTGGDVFEMTAEVKLKISNALKGNKNGLGIPCSKEKAKKISDAQKGRKFTEEHREKLSQSARKRHTPCSDTKKEKLRNSYPRMKKIYCQELNVVYNSVQDCARKLGIPATNISKVCKGRGHTLKGYHLSYYENNDTINA